jgi:F-type H+-transporting ATPase subunit gamma
MSVSIVSLRRKIRSAGDLHAVVRTMKAMAASSIGQYEQSLQALAGYYRTVERGLGACLRLRLSAALPVEQVRPAEAGAVVAIVFGSDQGLVGQFNDVVAACAVKALAELPGAPELWAVGGRVQARLLAAGLPPASSFAAPNSVPGIASLIGQLLINVEAHHAASMAGQGELHLFNNRPVSGAVYAPVQIRLLPLNEPWMRRLAGVPWPTKNAPEVMGEERSTVRAFLREYLFVSLFRACAESLASENASRLAAMDRADQNINELMGDLNRTFHQLRQSGMDAELFDVIAGFEALGPDITPPV